MTQAFGYRDHLLSASGYAREMSKAMAMIVGACQKMGEMVSQQGGKSLIIVSPLPEGILDERDKELEAFHKDVHGAMIDVIDAGPYLKKRVQGPKHLSNLYYPTDRHYTPEGYAIYAEAVSEIIKAELFGAKRTN